jgi:ankyrin repeat protein
MRLQREEGEGISARHMERGPPSPRVTGNPRSILLSLGADVQVKDKTGSTPIALAQHNGHVAVVRLLGKE